LPDQLSDGPFVGSDRLADWSRLALGRCNFRPPRYWFRRALRDPPARSWRRYLRARRCYGRRPRVGGRSRCWVNRHHRNHRRTNNRKTGPEIRTGREDAGKDERRTIKPKRVVISIRPEHERKYVT